MYRQADMDLWHGRVDQEPEGDARRWHQCVSPLPPNGTQRGVVLMGVCSDCGVNRNQGRPGAADGPDAIRRALANQAWHVPLPCFDAGNLYPEDDDLEKLQCEQADWVSKLLEAGHFPLLLGGGHEIAFGSYLGLTNYLKQQGESKGVGIINFDSHFDLRTAAAPSSGTPFLQMEKDCRQRQRIFRYFCLGISEVANTGALFHRANVLRAEWMLDEELSCRNPGKAEKRLRAFIDGCDQLYLSIDLDVLPAATAPGVSAPAPRGVPLEVLEHLLTFIRSEAPAKLRVADIAECNPAHDIDGRTAKVAARLCHTLVRGQNRIGGGRRGLDGLAHIS